MKHTEKRARDTQLCLWELPEWHQVSLTANLKQNTRFRRAFAITAGEDCPSCQQFTHPPVKVRPIMKTLSSSELTHDLSCKTNYLCPFPMRHHLLFF